jgi:hypothetical protein
MKFASRILRLAPNTALQAMPGGVQVHTSSIGAARRV